MKRLSLMLLIGASLVVSGLARPARSAQDDANGAAKHKKAKKAKKAKKVKAAATPTEATKPAEKPADADKAAADTTAKEKWIEGNIDVGARAATDAGDHNTYRSIVNLNSGVRLTNADLKLTANKEWLDDATLQLANIGDPYATVRLDMQKKKIYRFTGTYSDIAYFNYLPSYADPTLSTTGVFMNQRAYDTRVLNSQNELSFNQGGVIQPFIAFSRNSQNGHGISTLVDGNNMYPMVNNVNWRQDEYRMGARFAWQTLHGSFEQGSLSFKDDQSVASNGPGTGDRMTPYLKQMLQLTSGWQAYYIRGSGSYTKGTLAYSPVKWADVYGHIYYTDPTLHSTFGQLANGTLSTNDPNLAFNIYQRGFDQLYGNAAMPRRTYSFATEIRPTERLRIRQSLESDEFHDDSSSTLTSLFTLASFLTSTTASQTTTQPGLLRVSQQRSTTEVLYDVTSYAMMRAGYRYEWGDALNMSGLTSVTTPYETGQLKRHVGMLGLRLRPTKGITFTGDYEGSNGVKTFYRTGLADYMKVRGDVRATLRPNLFLNAGVHYLDNTNPADSVKAKFSSIQQTASLQWMPTAKTLTLIAEYTHSSIRSDVNYLVIFPWAVNNSFYKDNAHTGSTWAELALPGSKYGKTKLSFGGSFVKTSGSRPSHYYQPEGKIMLPVCNKVFLFSEWKYYGLAQTFYNYEGFRAHTITSGLRFQM